ncbi:MAG: hypothetical protein ACPGU5_08715 [Lishizhenia sp.]
MKKYILGILTVTLTLGSLSFGVNSCKKEEATVAKITVRDTSNALVVGAEVILYGVSTTLPPQPVTRRDTVFTDASGVATFDYTDDFQLGQAGFAVLNIDAAKGTLFGQGTIKINEEEENVETVFIQP